MSVYVDDLFPTNQTRQWPYKSACHLFSQNRHELHAFAFDLGMHPNWFQNRPHFPHYDLTEGKRFQALKRGAIPVTLKQAAEFLKTGVIDEDLNDGN